LVAFLEGSSWHLDNMTEWLVSGNLRHGISTGKKFGMIIMMNSESLMFFLLFKDWWGEFLG